MHKQWSPPYKSLDKKISENGQAKEEYLIIDLNREANCPPDSRREESMNLGICLKVSSVKR